jgi:hypothetical protein
MVATNAEAFPTAISHVKLNKPSCKFILVPHPAYFLRYERIMSEESLTFGIILDKVGFPQLRIGFFKI